MKCHDCARVSFQPATSTFYLGRPYRSQTYITRRCIICDYHHAGEACYTILGEVVLYPKRQHKHVTHRALRPIIALLLSVLMAACGTSDGTIPVAVARGEPLGQHLIDFAARADSGSFRLAEQSHDFNPGASREVLLDGWSAPESANDGRSSFAWAISERAELRLRLLDPNRDWLHFRARPYQIGPNVTQTVSVELNGVAVGNVNLRPGDFEVYTLRLPPEALTIGDNVVSFDFAYATSPNSLSASSEDRRTLAAAFDYVATTRDADPPEQVQSVPPSLEYGATAQGLRLPSDSETVFPLKVPISGVVEFGMLRHVTDDGSSVRGEVAVRSPSLREEVFFSQQSGDDSTTWRADLSRWAGEHVNLVFRAVGGQAGDGVTWVRPGLHGEIGGMNVSSNVVLIVIDTLRADYVGAYGGDVETPNMDALAQRGVLFVDAYSHVPITVPSHSSMFTSLIPSEHAALNNGSILSETHSTLAELMRDSYRSTAGFVSLGVLKREFGVAQGFDQYYDDFESDWWKSAGEVNASLLPWLERQPSEPFFLWAHYSDPHEPYTPPGRSYPILNAQYAGALDMDVTADGKTVGIEFDWPPGRTNVSLSAQSGRQLVRINNLRATGRLAAVCSNGCTERYPNPPAVEYVTPLPATIAVDNPTAEVVSGSVLFRVSERLSNEDVRLRYREEVEYVDREIGRLLTAVEAANAGRDTLVILTADHGEELGLHGPPGHVGRLYNSVLSVPLIISWPGQLPEGLVVSDPVSHVDLLPTVVDLLKIRDTGARSGRRLGPLMDPLRGDVPTVPIVAETFRPESPKDRKALIADRFKLILTQEDSLEELYNLDTDPDEQQNLVSDDPERAADLTTILLERLAEAEARAPSPEQQTLTEEQLERLRSLGYVR